MYGRGHIMKRNHWSIWGAAIVLAAALSICTAVEAKADFQRGLPLPTDDPAELNGIGANHQVGEELSVLDIARVVAHGLIRRVLYSIPTDDWGGLRLPVYQTTPDD